LPVKPTLIEQFAAKYSSGRLRTTGAVAAGILLIVGGLFAVQQVQLVRLRSQWKGMEKQVTQLQAEQNRIRQFQPWYDESFRNLSVFWLLSQAFPQTGVVTAKTIQIQGGSTVSCSGNTTDTASVLLMQTQLRNAPGVRDVKLDLLHGKSPMQFTFHFQYGGAQ